MRGKLLKRSFPHTPFKNFHTKFLIKNSNTAGSNAQPGRITVVIAINFNLTKESTDNLYYKNGNGISS